MPEEAVAGLVEELVAVARAPKLEVEEEVASSTGCELAASLSEEWLAAAVDESVDANDNAEIDPTTVPSSISI